MSAGCGRMFLTIDSVVWNIVQLEWWGEPGYEIPWVIYERIWTIFFLWDGELLNILKEEVQYKLFIKYNGENK